MSSRTIVQFNEVTKRYRFRLAVQNLTFSVSSGKIVGLIGTNGSGKSTTLKLMAGLTRPSHGQIDVCGQRADRRISGSVSYMSDTAVIYPFYTVGEMIHFYHEMFRDFDLKQAMEMVEFMELTPEQKTGELSKGNFGRLKLILALSRKSPLILMDEPLSGLDPLARAAILKALLSYVDLSYQTLIMSTHEVTEIEPLLDTAILMSDSRLVEVQEVDALRAQGMTLLDWMQENRAHSSSKPKRIGG